MTRPTGASPPTPKLPATCSSEPPLGRETGVLTPVTAIIAPTNDKSVGRSSPHKRPGPSAPRLSGTRTGRTREHHARGSAPHETPGHSAHLPTTPRSHPIRVAPELAADHGLVSCSISITDGANRLPKPPPRWLSSIPPKTVAHSGCEEGPPSSIYDPFARGGELLAEAAAHCALQRRGPSALDVRGSSPERDTWRLASMNLALQGVRPNLRLTRGAPWGSADGNRATGFDFILTNPPFNMSDSAGEARGDGEWPYGAPPVGNDNFAYVQHVLTSLAEGGSAGVVMPNKAGNSTNAAEAEIRRNMVERGVVRCAVALPDRLFSSTPVPVSLWFLGHPARPSDEVLFVDARSLGTLQKGKRVLDNADVRAVLDACGGVGPPPPGGRDGHGGAAAGAGWAGRERGVRSVLVSRETLRGRGYSLSPTDHVLADQPDGAAAEAAATEAWQDIEVRGRALREADAAVADAGLGPRSPQRPPQGSSGRLPTGWADVVLADVCAIKAGPSYSLLGTEQRTPDGDVPVVFPRHLRQGHIEDTGAERIPARLAERLRDFRLAPGDIACIRSGAMGPPALVRERQAGWVMSPNLLRLRLRPGAPVDPRYLLEYLCRPDAVTWVRDRAAATAAPSISARSLGNQPLVLPPLDEQRGIAEALAALEEQATAHRRFAEAVSQARAATAERLMGGWSRDE
ncbi:N-6 DNA methylase [Streptomyces sp. NPDC048340]|uniref:N-6 DNA methylase n=1 Tax=Streptomyces sp. NPDC048340 TaxID=3365537 RepID=UPI00371B2148